MKKLTIIPARSGSKGLQDKNILEIHNLPLFVWSIMHAKYYSNNDDLIVLSSDSHNYLEIAEEYGATPFKRSLELSQDTSSTESVMKEVSKNYNLNADDLIILLQPTSPIRHKDTIKKIISCFDNQDVDSALTLTPYHKFIWKDIDNFVFPQDSERPRRQEFKDTYYETGSIYATRFSNFEKSGNRVSGNTKGVDVDFDEVLEIDTFVEFEIISNYIKETIGEWEEELSKLSSRK